MAGAVWVLAEPGETGLARISAEVATAARVLAEAAGREAVGVVAAADQETAAGELARYVGRVLAIAEPGARDHAWAAVAAARVAPLAERERPACILVGATP
ncbi:MAG TPA: hypothetical protein VIV06_11585, partial [Candidatus Limnocylindrales bacterium]